MAMTDGEKIFLAVVAFLVLKGLLDPKDAQDKERVRRVWDDYRKPKKPKEPSLFS